MAEALVETSIAFGCKQHVAMAAAAAAGPPPHLRTQHRISASYLICPFLRVGPRHLAPVADSKARRYPRYGLIQGKRFRIRARNWSADYEHAVPLRVGFSRAGFDFGRKIGGKYCAHCAPLKSAVVGGDFGSYNHNWAGNAKTGTLKAFLIEVMRILEFRSVRRILWARSLAAIVEKILLAGVLASRSAEGGGFVAARYATLGVAIFFILSLLVEEGKLQLVYEKFQLTYVKANEQLQRFGRKITKVAYAFLDVLASVLSSSSSLLVGKLGGVEGGEKLSCGDDFYISEAQAGSIARISRKTSVSKNRVVNGKPHAEMVAMNMTLSVAHPISIITTTAMASADVCFEICVKWGIENLSRVLQSAETALLAKQTLLHFKLNKVAVEALVSGSSSDVLCSTFVGSECVGGLILKLAEYESGHGEKEIIEDYEFSKFSDPQQQQHKSKLLPVKLIPVEEASRTLPFVQFRTSSAAHRQNLEETLKSSPLVSRTSCIPDCASYERDTAQAANRATVDDSLPSEVFKRIPENRPITEALTGLTLKGDDVLKLSPSSNSLIEEQNPPLNNSVRNKQKQVIETQRMRSCSQDLWWNDFCTQAIEQKVFAGGDWVARSNEEWRNDDSQLLELVFIVEENVKGEALRRDGIGNKRGVNAFGRGDFWGKKAGITSKISEQRGILTKRQATGRGSSFGSLDGLEDNQLWGRSRRQVSNKEQRQIFSKGLPSSSRTGQPWYGQQHPSASGEAMRDLQQLWHDGDSAAAEDDYAQGEADIIGPHIYRRDRYSDVAKHGSLVNMERWVHDGVLQQTDISDAIGSLVYPRSVGSRFSPQKRTSTRILSSVPSNSQKEGSCTLQAIDEASLIRQESEGGNEGSYCGSDRARSVPPNPDGHVYEGSGVGLREGRSIRDSSAYTQNQSKVTERKYALQQSKQAQTLKFERYLEEADALLEEGMQGLEGRIEVGVAERMLYDAAILLECAAEMDPADLTAVGQWGNTLLVHGELKLKLSQQIRSMLPSPRVGLPSSNGRGAMADRIQESMELTLQEVCEECEELLVDAGRKYRRALILERGDIRALYNWGLALCYRGQLIAEDGGVRAMQDADKVYLAAVDKFEALLGISEDYAAGGTAAFLNWGLVMRDRSRLRTMGDKERVQLLLQAMGLFHDALRLDPQYGQARGAVAACSAELKELEGYGALQRQDIKEAPTRNWWQRGD